jgi:peptidoglycan/xylan/chitin deacetylase (PgdA/CDA1 family)
MLTRRANYEAGTVPSRLGQMGRYLGAFIPPALLRGVGRPSAVFFHGVEPETCDHHVQVNHHETLPFRIMMEALKTHFDVLPLSELDDALARPLAHRRSVFVMSDDGYANTLSVAAPLLEELGLPWTLFVSSHHIDTRERNPVFIALMFFHHAPPGHYGLPHFPVDVPAERDARMALATASIPALKTLDMGSAKEVIAAMTAALDEAGLTPMVESFSSENFLTWDGVRELKARGVEIGAHADWHWPLNAGQTREQLRHQAVRPKARIEAEIGPCRAFAYPFGNTGDVCGEAWRAVRDAGYDYAFTTLAGTLGASGNPYLLPRYGIGENETHLASLIPLLSAGDTRVARWQSALAA